VLESLPNFSALAFPVALVLFWTLIGRALFAVFCPRFGVLRSWLLAPGLGMAALLLTIMPLNQLGLPIRSFARLLALGWLTVAVYVLWRWRPLLPVRGLAPFAAAVLFSLLWTGWPGLQSGFNWISYGNDDMANYCLSAERFADRGFYDAPTMAELSGRDYSSYFFFMYVPDMMRFGAEHILAWATTTAGMKATQAFMPTILALALTQLCAAAGLVLQSGRRRRHALVTAWLLAVSPLFMLGTLYQLIAQVGGVALLLVTVALLTRSWDGVRRRDLIRYSVLPSIAGAALCIFYPETTPFAILTYVAYTGLALVRRRLSPAVATAITAYVLVGVILLLRHNLISYISTLVMQFSSSMHAANLLLSLFPYFLLPTGFSNLFGWMPIARDFPEPVVTLSIAAGIALAAVLLVWALRDAWRLTVASILLIVQGLLAVQLYRAGNDFGLYKLAMFMQPALAAALAGLALSAIRRPRRVAIAVAVFGLATAPSALHYTRASQGLQSGGMTELRFGSQLGMRITPPDDPDAQITSGIENVVAAKFAVAELRGRQVALASRDYFFPNTRIDFRDPPLPVLFHPHFERMAVALPIMRQRNAELITTSMLWRTEFSQPVLTRGTDYYLFLANELSLFNKFGRPARAPEQVFVLEPAAAVRNRLMFVHSGRGNHYYLGDRRRISFFQQETDLFAPDRDFHGLGRFMLLRIERPTDELYLRMAATRTLHPNRSAWKPEAVVHGATDLPLGAIGSGAFNLFVGPIRPYVFEGAHYIAIDLAEVAQPIMDRRAGLKALYNRYVPLDYRRLVGWARDISVLSPDEYRQLRRPLHVTSFPRDLATAETLEFSGAYEDGWLSPQSRFVLGPTPAEGCLRIRGFIPELPGSPLGSGSLLLTVGGQRHELPAATGSFDWLIPVPHANAGATEIRIEFTATAKLPGGDDRPAGGKLDLLEILPALPSHTFHYGIPGTPRLAATGIDQDGWMAGNSTIELPPAPAPVSLLIRLEHAPVATAAGKTVRVQLDGTAAPSEHVLTPGHNTVLRLQLPASALPRTLRFDAGAVYPLPAPDTRHRACRLVELQLAPDA
jgi:hypothetical protein